ncbi:uncharacterized protein LOC120394972 [Mauremys reevesii]|uniref:uncharacterized protein LOC120394972 n=1 Tax=Mauremys reevesii TaxID=260615 RepID=UPI00193EFAFC|nr:uncharacterized protein LOC120394972 [Mauremys reevesii]
MEHVASNRLCAQPPCEPPGSGMKRKRSARGREAEEEAEEKALFYMKVQAVNGVSVGWETGAGFEDIRKRPRIFKTKYIGGESFAGSDLSSSHTKSELGDVDSEADLEALTQHVKQGLRQGFSCRVYYRVLGQLRARGRSQRGRVLCPWESQRSRESPPHQSVSAGSPEDTAEEGVSAPAGPRDPSQQPSTATSITSHSLTRGVEPVASNRLCAQPPCEPPGADVKRKRSARGREAEEAEEKWICFKDIVICVEVPGWSESGRC